MSNANESASLRVAGEHLASPLAKPTDMLRCIGVGYADYLKNGVHWGHNECRDLILQMKIAIEQLVAERDDLRREIMQEQEKNK